MRRLLQLALLLSCSLPAAAQLNAPSFGLTIATAVTYAAPVSMTVGAAAGQTIPSGASICVGVNVTPTAVTAGTCDTTAGKFTYTGAFTVSGTANLSAIVTQAGQTNSAPVTLVVTIPKFSTAAGTYAYNPVITLFPDFFHAGGTICFTTDGSTPTESSNSCTHGTTYSGPITVASSETLNILFTKSGQSDTTATAAYVIRSPETWFVRTDGGTEFSANVPTGQCNGLADVAYPGTGVNQNCAFNDVRYLWADNSGNPNAWVIAGGDTVVIRGCTALSSQTNPSNPNCRLGYDNATNGNAPNLWCGFGNPNTVCFNPPIPAGSTSQPTQILGGCAFGTYTCTPISNKYPYGTTNETQLFGGFALTWAFNLGSTSNVTIEGIELTTHNGVCTSAGSPSFPRGCSTSPPYDDFAANGFLFNTTSSNIVMQDVYVHGMNAAGLDGPIGGPISMTRVFSGFNAFAGWNFDDGDGTNDAPGSGINAETVTMMFNGCYEQFPITATYPAQVCYDTNSGGFGDSWSGQGVGTESVLTSFICDHCVDDYNTKDAFIGPHISIPTLTITNSVAIGNMGSNWKWGGEDGVPATVTFQNNLTVNNCTRMEAPITGVPSTYNQFLTGFCRAGGNGMASVIPIGSIWNLQNNTFITAQQTALFVACVAPDTTCAATINSTNNVFLGFVDPNNPIGSPAPPNSATVATLYELPAGTTLNVSHNDEFGMKDGTCPSTTNGTICSDPLFVNEPAQTWPGAESDLDVFNAFSAGNSFNITSGSPLRGTGVTVSGLTTDFNGTARPSPPSIGAVEFIGIAPPTGLSAFWWGVL